MRPKLHQCQLDDTASKEAHTTHPLIPMEATMMLASELWQRQMRWRWWCSWGGWLLAPYNAEGVVIYPCARASAMVGTKGLSPWGRCAPAAGPPLAGCLHAPSSSSLGTRDQRTWLYGWPAGVLVPPRRARRLPSSGRGFWHCPCSSDCTSTANQTPREFGAIRGVGAFGLLTHVSIHRHRQGASCSGTPQNLQLTWGQLMLWLVLPEEVPCASTWDAVDHCDADNLACVVRQSSNTNVPLRPKGATFG